MLKIVNGGVKMTDEQMSRLENYENMHQSIIEGLDDAIMRMDQLKRQGKGKSATFKQLMVQKMTYKNILDMYKLFGIK